MSISAAPGFSTGAAMAEIDAAADPKALIGSSTSGILPTDLQRDMKHPERMFVAHPYNPVYLLPLAELVGGEKTSRAVLEDAKAKLAPIGMKGVIIKKEIEAFRAREYWTIDALFDTPRGQSFKARLTHLNGQKLDKFDIPTEAQALAKEQEEALLRDPEHQARLAEALADAIRRHFTRRPPTGRRRTV